MRTENARSDCHIGQQDQRAAQPLKSSDQYLALHFRYVKIGLPAVAAAARYQSGGKDFMHPHGRSRLDLIAGRKGYQRAAASPLVL